MSSPYVDDPLGPGGESAMSPAPWEELARSDDEKKVRLHRQRNDFSLKKRMLAKDGKLHGHAVSRETLGGRSLETSSGKETLLHPATTSSEVKPSYAPVVETASSVDSRHDDFRPDLFPHDVFPALTDAVVSVNRSMIPAGPPVEGVSGQATLETVGAAITGEASPFIDLREKRELDLKEPLSRSSDLCDSVGTLPGKSDAGIVDQVGKTLSVSSDDAVSSSGTDSMPAENSRCVALGSPESRKVEGGVSEKTNSCRDIRDLLEELYRESPDKERFIARIAAKTAAAEKQGDHFLAETLRQIIVDDPRIIQERMLERLQENERFRGARNKLLESRNREAERRQYRTSRLPKDRTLLFTLPKGESERDGFFLWGGDQGALIDPDFNALEMIERLGGTVDNLDAVFFTLQGHPLSENGQTDHFYLPVHHRLNAVRKRSDPDGRNDFPDRDRPYLYHWRKTLSVYSEGPVTQDVQQERRQPSMPTTVYFFAAGRGALYEPPLPAEFQDNAAGFPLAAGLAVGEEFRRVLWTSFTRLASDCGSEEIWRCYPEEYRQEPDVLFVEVGPIHDFEERSFARQSPRSLGLAGAARMIESLRPKLAVLCGIAREAASIQWEFAAAMEESLRRTNVSSRIVCADPGLILDLEQGAFLDAVSAGEEQKDCWRPLERIASEEYDGKRYFFDREASGRFRVESKEIAESLHYQQTRRRGLYFKASE